MKILIDDRKSFLPNDETPDVIFRNPDAFWGWPLGIHDEIYLDHDLGEGKPTGYDIIVELERMVHESENAKAWFPRKIVCVSLNGAGRKRIELVIESIKRMLA